MYDADFAYGQGRCRDISVSGLALEMPAPVPVGTRLNVYFELPTGHAVEEEAEVVRSSQDAVALRFVAPSTQTRAVVRSYVTQQLSDAA